MAPIDDPELIYLAIKQPKLKGDEYGAQPLAEIFKPVVKNSLEYLKVRPYTEKQMADATHRSQLKVQNYVNQSMGTVENNVKREAPTNNFRRRENNKTISAVWRSNE